ncbi:hypothetical protein NMG60_11032259 [Bertholletia excelsa]
MSEDLEMLPEDCLSTILSLTSPADACRMAVVSSFFRSAADSDVAWDRLLPLDYLDVIARSVAPLEYSSKKELFHRLCSPLVIDGGRKRFQLDKLSGKKTYGLSARELLITHGNEQGCWSWEAVPESRFSEVAVLKTVTRLEIEGRIPTRTLSPNTKYGAYLVLKISETAFGLDAIPSEISITVGKIESNNTAILRCPGEEKKKRMESLIYSNRLQMLRQRVNPGDYREPNRRDDGWMEVEIGKLFTGEDEGEVKMRLVEIKGNHLKGGLVVEGIEIRPEH